MRVYMLPITITATLMSAHIAAVERTHQAPSRPALQVQVENAANGKVSKTPPG